jgi:hypothetical protein
LAVAFADIAKQGHALDVVANAGIQLFGQEAAIADLDLEVWNRTVQVH